MNATLPSLKGALYSRTLLNFFVLVNHVRLLLQAYCYNRECAAAAQDERQPGSKQVHYPVQVFVEDKCTIRNRQSSLRQIIKSSYVCDSLFTSTEPPLPSEHALSLKNVIFLFLSRLRPSCLPPFPAAPPSGPTSATWPCCRSSGAGGWPRRLWVLVGE